VIDVARAARDLEERRDAILKATSPQEGEATSQPAGDGEGAGFSAASVIEPPYDPRALCLLFEHSNALRQNVDAYSVNVDGFGHRFEAAIDFDAEDVDARVAECIFLERVAARERGELGEGAELEPSAEEIAARRKELVGLARIERARLESFFAFCCFDHSFTELRRRTRQDLETTGNAYWEVLRDARGRIARFVYVPSFTMRLLRLDAEATAVMDRVRVSPVSFETAEVRRRLRRYVQIEGTSRVVFKSLGDPRVISRKTGEVFDSVEALRQRDPSDGPATEILHFAIHSSRSPYGVPRWIGVLLSVLGSRAAEEVNHDYFDHKTVPPLAVLVSGGHLGAETVARLERFFEERIKGRENFHKVLIVQADTGAKPSDGPNRTKIDLRPLTDAQQQDALFQDYDQRNVDKVGASFRVPALLRGESKDFNRSVADAQLRFAEDQVFQPERDAFDDVMNRRVLPDMGIRFYRFRSLTPVTRDPERLTTSIEKLVRVGVLTPEEGRLLAQDVFNRELPRIHDEWVKRPITLTLAGIQNQSVSSAGGDGAASHDDAEPGDG
jgi:PBSX family phage portal protein